MIKNKSITLVTIIIIILLISSINGDAAKFFNVNASVNTNSSATSHVKTIFNNSYGGKNWDAAYSVIVTTDGGYVLVGVTNLTEEGGGDMYLVKTDENGHTEWNQTFGGDFENNEIAHSVVENSDGGFTLAGYTESHFAYNYDMWLIKINANGNEEWNRTYGGNPPRDDRAYCVAATADGGYILAGFTESYGAGRSDMWLVKTDTNGNEEWNQTFGGHGNDRANSVIVTADGGYAIAGETYSYGAAGRQMWLVKTDAYGNEEWNQTLSVEYETDTNSIIATTDGGYALVGTTGSYTADDHDMLLVKTDAFGNEEWRQTFEGNDDKAHSIVATSDGGFALAGQTYSSSDGGTLDMLLVKTDASGNEEWNQTFGGNSGEIAHSIIATSDGGFALAGQTWSYGAGRSDMWLIKVIPEDSSSNPFLFSSFGVIAMICFFILLSTYYKRKKAT